MSKNKQMGAWIFLIIIAVVLGFAKMYTLKKEAREDAKIEATKVVKKSVDARFKAMDGVAIIHYLVDSSGNKLCFDPAVVDYLKTAYNEADTEYTTVAKDIISNEHGHLCPKFPQ